MSIIDGVEHCVCKWADTFVINNGENWTIIDNHPLDVRYKVLQTGEGTEASYKLEEVPYVPEPGISELVALNPLIYSWGATIIPTSFINPLMAKATKELWLKFGRSHTFDKLTQ